MLTSSLPTATTSFVGRAEELSRIAGLLADPNCRLLTLLGPGGIGKTRLALQAAGDQQPNYTHGVYFVPLAPVGSADLLPAAIAGTLQLSFHGAKDLHSQIIRYLSEKQLLLVMDNFEHLLAGSDLVTGILQAAPGVRFLVTSRERLNVQEEWMLTLDGLRAPDDEADEPLESYSAVQLFVQRARQVQANFSLDDNADAVKLICRQVEGMPLGLELAASWLRAMSCSQIAAQIERSLDFLTTSLRNVPERHRSLRAVFEQSWDLLSADERAVMMRTSVFRGGFDLDAAVEIAGATLPLLAGLVDKSLIRLNDDGRYDLHELVRQYAAGKLTADETVMIADRHLNYCLTLAERAEAHMWGRDQLLWFDRLDADLDNLRAALTWSVRSEQAETGLRLAGSLGWFFLERSHLREGLAWLEHLLEASTDTSSAVRGKALQRAAELTGIVYDDGARVQLLLEQALDLARADNDRWNTAWALANLGFYSEWKLGFYTEGKEHPERALATLDESLVLFREIQDPMGLNHVLRRCALIMIARQDYAAARALLDEALTGARDAGDVNGMAHALHMRANVLWYQDRDLQQARNDFENSLSLFRKARNTFEVMDVLQLRGIVEMEAGNLTESQAFHEEMLLLIRSGADDFLLHPGMIFVASIAKLRGQFQRAARLLGAAEPGLKGSAMLPNYFLVTFEEHIAAVRAELGDAVFDELFEAGKLMTPDQMISYTLEGGSAATQNGAVVRTDVAQPSVVEPLVEPLTERERELLRLVAAGRSNRQIAAELYLALGTVKWYLNSINTKLGVASRTQAVARARELGLFT